MMLDVFQRVIRKAKDHKLTDLTESKQSLRPCGIRKHVLLVQYMVFKDAIDTYGCDFCHFLLSAV